jgi:hypothetical protein
MARGQAKQTPSDDKANPDNNSANVGYEAQLWQMADALRGSMDAAEYKHVVLGLIFLKYISDAFEERHAYLSRGRAWLLICCQRASRGTQKMFGRGTRPGPRPIARPHWVDSASPHHRPAS